jgi:Tol biopolymer transport system component
MDIAAIWSPDGNQIAFYRFAEGQAELYQKPATGAGPEKRLARLGALARPSDWSADGKFIAFSLWASTTRCDLWILPLEGDRKPYPYLQTGADEYSAQISPDGRWMAYVSDDGGGREVWVQSIPLSGAKRQISTAGGSQPRWRRDGRELFYAGPDGKLMAVPVRIGNEFDAGAPKPLSGITVTAPPGPSFFYKPAANGSRFFVSEPGAREKPRITILLSWQFTLKR